MIADPFGLSRRKELHAAEFVRRTKLNQTPPSGFAATQNMDIDRRGENAINCKKSSTG
jgi:hypothetical protein